MYLKYRNDPVIGSPEMGVFFFGIFYLMYRGLWGHAFIFLLLILPTLGLAWIWYIFKTRNYLAKKYYLEGYFRD